jgi:hypothetical protein
MSCSSGGSRDLLYGPPPPPPPFVFLFLVVFTCILLCILMKRLPKMCNIVINQIGKINK